MDPASFNSNPSFGMTLEEKQRYIQFRDSSGRRRQESHISNPSFDMHNTNTTPRSVPTAEDEYLGGRGRSSIPPTPAPTNESDDTTHQSSSSSQLPNSPLSSEFSRVQGEASFTSSSYARTKRPLHMEQETPFSDEDGDDETNPESQPPSLLNYSNFIGFLASATVAYLQGPKVEEVMESHATLLTPAYFVSTISLGVVLGQLGVLLLGLQPRISQIPAKSPPEYLTLKLPFDLYIAWTIASSAIQINVAASAWKLTTLYQIVVAGISLFGVFALAVWFIPEYERSMGDSQCIGMDLSWNFCRTGATRPFGVHGGTVFFHNDH